MIYIISPDDLMAIKKMLDEKNFFASLLILSLVQQSFLAEHEDFNTLPL